MAKTLETVLQIRDNFSNVSKEYKRQLQTNRAEMKLVQNQLQANEKDTEALARKEELLANRIKLTNAQISAAEQALKAENTQLDKKKQSISSLEKEIEDLTQAYKKNVAELGEEDKQTKKSLTSLNKKTKELKSANKEYNTAANNTQKMNLQLLKLNGELQDSSREFAKNELSIQSMNKELVKSGVAVDTLDNKLDKLGKKDFSHIGDSLMGLGVGLSAAVGAMTALGSNELMNFEYGNTKINTIAKLDDAELTKMGNDIRKLSDDMGVSIASVQEAYYQALSSGMEFEQVQTLVTKSIETSKASFASLEGVIDVATSIMNAWKLSTEDTDRVMNSLYMTAELGKVTVSELSNDLGRVVASASQAGLEIEQVLSAVAQASLGGIKSSEGITYLNSMITELSKSGTVASDIIKEELGMSFQEAVKSGMELSEVIDAIENSDTSLMDAFGSQEASRFASVLSDGEQYLDLLGQIEQSSGAVDSAFAKVEDTQYAEFEKTMARLKNSLIELGVASEPIFDMFVDGIEALSETMQNVDTDTVKATAAISALTIGLGAALKVATKLNGKFGDIKNAMNGSSGAASIISAITGLGAKGAAIATGLGGIALAVTGIIATFDALSTSTEEQTQKVKDQEAKVISLQSQYDELNSIDSSKRTSSQEAIIAGLEKEIELNNRILQQEQDKLIKNTLYGEGRMGTGLLGSASGRELDITQTKEHIAQLEQALQYATSQIEKDKLIIKIGAETSKLNGFIDEFTSYMNDLGEGYDLATDGQKELIDELKVFQKTLNSLDSSDAEQTHANIASSIDKVSSSTKDAIKSQQDYMAEFEDHKSKLEGYTAILEELDSKHALSADTVSTIANEYPHLLSSLDDEAELRKTLTGLIADQEVGIQTSYANMLSASGDYYNAELMQSEEFYNAKILGEEQLYNTLTGGIEGYFNSLGEAYKVDLKNYTDLESSKMETTQDLIGKLAGAWSDYFSVTMDGVKFDKKRFLQENPYATEHELLEMEYVYSEATKYQKNFQDLANKMTLDPITLKPLELKKNDDSKSKLEAERNKKFKNDVDAIKKYGQDLEYEISKMESQLQLAKNKEDQALVESLSKQLSELYSEAPKIDARMAEELRLLKDKTTSQEHSLELEGQIKDLSLSWYDKKNRQLEYEKSLKEENIELMKENLELIEEEIDKLGEKLTLELEKSIYGSGGKNEWEAINDSKIEAIEDEIDALKDQTSELEKQEALKEHQLRLSELQEKLENAKKQRTTKEWQKQADGSYQWVYSYDKDLVAGLEESIADELAAEEKRLEQEKIKSKEAALRKEIELLQKEKQAKQEHFNKSKEALLEYLMKNKEMLAENGIETLEIVGNNLTLIGEEFDTKMEVISDDLQSKLDKIKDMFAEALAIGDKMDNIGSSSGGGGGSSGDNVYGNKGDSGKYYYQYPDGSIEVNRPDGSVSVVKPGDSGYSHTVDAMEQDDVEQKYPKNAARSMMNDGLLRYDWSSAKDIVKSSTYSVSTFKTPSISNSNQTTSINVQNVELPNVNNGQSFVSELQSIASRLVQKSKLVPSGA